MVAAWRVARVPAEVASVRPQLPERLPACVLDAEFSPCARLERDHRMAIGHQAGPSVPETTLRDRHYPFHRVRRR